MSSAQELIRNQVVAGAWAKFLADHPELADSVKQPWSFYYAGNARGFFTEIFAHVGEDWLSDDWTAWRAFVSALFGEPMGSDEEERVFRECTRLQEPAPERITRAWVPVGRRGGKSRVFAAIAVYLACCYDWKPYLAAGELGVLPVIAQDRKAAQTIMGYVKGFLSHPELKKRVLGDPAVESIKMADNVVIEVVTASFRAVRSRTVIAALCDEIAFWRFEDGSANPDTEIIAAIEPAMATIPNALLLAASSPYGRKGVLWDNYDRHFGHPGRNLVWQAPTWVMHPKLSRDSEFIRSKYEEDPIAAEAEYGSQFRTDVQAFITREVVESAIVQGRHELQPIRSLTYKAFVDPSGGSSDSMTMAIGHKDPATGRGVIDVIRERRPPYSPEVVVKEFAELLKVFRVHRVRGDRYGGDWPRERFRVHGIEYEVSKKTKNQIYLELLPILNAGRGELLDEPRGKQQFMQLERKTTGAGREVIDHPKGSHDDVANVVAGCLVELLSKRDTLTIDPGLLARSARVVTPQPSGPRW